MRILFVGMYPDEYSIYRNVFFQNLIFAMADAGNECTVISPVPVTRYRRHLKIVSHKRIDKTPNENEITIYHPRYISVSSKKIGGINSGLFSEALFQKCALKAVQKLEKCYDVVYGHFFLLGGLAAIRIGRALGIPSFIAYGECNYETEIVQSYRELTKNDIDGLSGIIAVSTHNAKVLKEKGIFRNIPMIVAPNSVNMNLFKKHDRYEAREKLGLPQDKFIVGFVGGFIDRKGDKRLLAAANRIPNVYLAFAGKGTPAPKGKRVLLCNSMRHEEIPLFLNAVDIFCLPTLNEGSCNAIVEAMACGLPIISSDLPFNDDILDETNSIRIDPNDIEAIRAAIQELYQDKEHRDKLAHGALETASRLRIENRAQKIITFIETKIGDYA